MIIKILCLLFGTLAVLQHEVSAVVNHKEFKRREAAFVGGGGGGGNSYGPPPASSPLPIPVYGIPGPVAKYPPPPPDIPPPVSVPYREYGVPHSSLPAPTPSKEYGMPFLQYGPPKINIEYGVPLFKNVPLKNNFASGNGFQSAKSSFFDQIKSHFGVPKPVYGPPHHIQRPNALPIQTMYLPPLQSYGPPPKPLPYPGSNFGHSLKLSPVYGVPHFGYPSQSLTGPRPSNSYGHPEFNSGSKITAISISSHPAPVYGPPPLEVSPTYVPPSHQPAPVYGPPKSTPSYEPLPHPPATSYGVPEAPISTSSSNIHHGGRIASSHSIKQIHVIEGNNDHGGPTVSCDGWKPIPGPVGGNIQGHGSVFNVDYNTGYNGAHTSASSDLSHHNIRHHGNVVSSLTDEQLVAIALGGDGNQQIAIATSDDEFNTAQNTLDGGVTQSHSLELPQDGLSDSYNAPPLDSYAPNSVHSPRYDTINLNQNDPIGLIPPSGVYGIPSGGSYHAPAPLPPPPQNGHAMGTAGLGISYGAQSGNLKPWLHPGSPPKKPVLYRPPVPQGLLESIGATVQHPDQYGVPPENEPPSYIPPPPAEIPQQISSEENHVGSHSEHVPLTQALPSIQEPRFNQAQDCGHGPILNGGGGEFGNYELSSNQVTSYSNVDSQKQQISSLGNDIPSDSYGPPPSGNIGDAFTYESKQNSAHSLSQLTNSHSQSSSDTQIDSNHDQQNFITGDKSLSHTVTIPVQGQLGSYQLQFQSADSLGDNLGEQTNHEQILSEGLLQTILSAIEQPNPTVSDHHQQHHQDDTINSRVDHKDADEFLRSAEGEKVLSESNDTQNK